MPANDILAKVSVIINAQTAQLGKDLKGAQNQLSSFSKGLTNLAGTIGVAFSVQQVASFGFEIAKLAGEVEGVKVAFDKLPDSERLMKSLKEATSDTVSELDLMKRTVQAANFGISLQALPKLLEFATLRAQQTGESVDYLVNSIVTGIGRKCITGDTQVKMSSGNTKRLDELVDNEVVKTLTLTGAVVNGVVKAVHVNGVRDVYKVSLVNGYHVTGTDNHRLYTSSGYKMISELDTNSELLTDVGLINIDSITYAGREVVYDVTLPETENFFANGIVSHNSPLILDNLGISAVALKDKLGDVSTAAATVGQVAEAVGKIAEENLTSMAGFSDNTKTSVEQLTAAWENFKASLGKNVAIGGGLNFLTGLLETFTQSDDFKITAQVENLALALNAGEKTSTGFANAIKELADNGADLSITEKELEKILNRMKNAPQFADDLKNKLKEVGIEIINLNKTALGPQAFKFEDIFGTNGGTETIGIIAALEDKIKGLGDSIKDATSVQSIRSLQAELEIAKSALNDLLKPPPNPVIIPVEFDLNFDYEAIQKKVDEIPPIIVDLEIGDESTAQADKVIENIKRIREEASQLAAEFSNVVKNGLQNVLVGFAEDLGRAAVGVGNFGENILQAVAGFAKQFGALLISAGLAKIAFEKLAISGIGAVVAGVALIAAASAVTAHVGKSANALTSVGGSSTGGGVGGGYRSSGLGAQGQNSSSVSFVIKGEDLWGTLNNYNRNSRYTNAVGG
jgi:hypothetical protein